MGSASEIRRCWTVGRYPSRGELHLGDFVVLCKGELAVFCFEGIDVHGAIRRLRGYVFVERIPGNTLHVMVVFGNLADDIA